MESCGRNMLYTRMRMLLHLPRGTTNIKASITEHVAFRLPGSSVMICSKRTWRPFSIFVSLFHFVVNAVDKIVTNYAKLGKDLS